MDERFPDKLVTWRHKTYPGIKVDEIFGMDSKSMKVFVNLARQVYSEQGGDTYRVIDHFANGAPYLENYHGRISITHTSHLYIVATLPKTPEVDLQFFNTRSAMGIDAEPLNREQVLRVRSKFLTDSEIEFVGEKNLIDNILAWTAKEALYKAALGNINFKEGSEIIKLPVLEKDPTKGSVNSLGKALIKPEDEKEPLEMFLYSYQAYGCCVTLAYSPKCAKFGK